MFKIFWQPVLLGMVMAVGVAYLYSDGHEYTMDYYIEMHEWDRKMNSGTKLLTLLPDFTPAQAIRAEEQWRVFGIKTTQFRFIERWPKEDDWRLVCYRVTFKESTAKLFFWTPRYYDDVKFGTVIKTRYNE